MSARCAGALILLLLSSGCATVSVDGGRRLLGGELPEPVAFLILQGDAPAGQAQRLEGALESELRRRGISTRFTIVPGVETSREVLIGAALSDVPSLVMLEPSNATDYAAYAFQVVERGKNRYEMVWEGRIHASDGFPPYSFPDVAARLAQKLVADRVLRGAGPSSGAATH